MTFTTLPQLAHFIDRHHSVFGCPFNTRSTLSVLGDLNQQIRTTPVCGATYNAWLKLDDGSELPTQIEINKHPDGYWMIKETVRNDCFLFLLKISVKYQYILLNLQVYTDIIYTDKGDQEHDKGIS